MTSNSFSQFHLHCIRFFNDSTGSRIALYGSPSAYADGWIENRYIHEIFDHAPESVVINHLYPLQKIPQDARFNDIFLSRLSNRDAVINSLISAANHHDGDQITKFRKHIAFFPDIPMSGGGALAKVIYQVFGQQNCLKVWDPRFGADVSPSNFSNIQPTDFSSISAVVGHLSFSQFLLNNTANRLAISGQVKVFATVCDPLERIERLYNFIKSHSYHPRHSTVIQVSLQEFSLAEPANYQFGYLCEDQSETIDSIFERASVYPSHKLREGMETFLSCNYNLSLPSRDIHSQPPLLVPREASSIASIDDLDNSVLTRLRNIHNLDTDLYLSSKQRFGEC